MRTIKLCFYGLLVLIFAIFILQNYSTLTYSVALRLNLGFLSLMSVPLPLFLAVPLFFFFGLFLATIYRVGGTPSSVQGNKTIKEHQAGTQTGIQRRRPDPSRSPSRNPNRNPKKNPGQKPRQEAEPKKKPDEGTIVSSGPLFKKTDSPPGNKPPPSVPDLLSVYD